MIIVLLLILNTLSTMTRQTDVGDKDLIDDSSRFDPVNVSSSIPLITAILTNLWNRIGVGVMVFMGDNM
jgi:hypothetical protein